MEPINFAYWLQGFFELSKSNKLTEEQVAEIKNHLSLVFNKVTPVLNDWQEWSMTAKPKLDNSALFFKSAVSC